MTHENLHAFIETVDQKYSDAHTRHREQLAEQKDLIDSNYQYLRGRIETVDSKMGLMQVGIDSLGRAPVNLDKVVFSPKLVAAIVGTIVGIYGAFLLSTASLRSDVRDILTRMEAQQTAAKARADLQDVQQQNLTRTVDDMRRQLQLEQYDIQHLKDLVEGKKKGG